jgi:hypothetical protein
VLHADEYGIEGRFGRHRRFSPAARIDPHLSLFLGGCNCPFLMGMPRDYPLPAFPV